MLWIALILSSAMLVTARSRSETREEAGLEPFETGNIFVAKDRQLWSPVYQKDLYAFLNHLDAKSEASEPKITRKRALSVLSRWKPLGSLGMRMKAVHRVPSRAPMISMVPEMNLISAESSEAVRPLGQPLRWGRKR